jgi:sulfonate transport system permease protein
MSASTSSHSGLWGDRLRGGVIPLALLLAWVLAAEMGLGNPQIFIPPSAVVAAAIESIGNGGVTAAIGATIVRALSGFALGALFGLLIGVPLGLSGVARNVLAPSLNAARQVALFAWIPLLSAWLGTGETMKIALIALGAFFPMLLNAEAGCRNVPMPFREVGRLAELDRREQVRHIILPSAAPVIISGLEMSFATAWLGTIGAEYLIGTGYVNGAGDGLGVFLAASREYGRMDLVIVGILALAVTGLALDRLIVGFSKRLSSWQSH